MEVDMGVGRVWLSLNGVREAEPLADGLPTWDLYFAGPTPPIPPRHRARLTG